MAGELESRLVLLFGLLVIGLVVQVLLGGQAERVDEALAGLLRVIRTGSFRQGLLHIAIQEGETRIRLETERVHQAIQEHRQFAELDGPLLHSGRVVAFAEGGHGRG